MAAYMITYDLNATGQKYTEVIETIKSNSLAWCCYWKSSYLVKSNLTPSEFAQKLKPHLDSNDRLIIIEVKDNYDGWLAKDDWTWIKENIFN